MQIFSQIVLTVFLGLSVIQDIKEQKLSNTRNVVCLLCGLLLSVFRTDLTVADAFFGAVAALGVGLICWMLRVFRAGDAKLLCAVGAYIGIRAVLPCFIYTMVAGALMGLPLFLRKRLRKEKEFTRIPFAPAIAAGTLLAVHLGICG